MPRQVIATPEISSVLATDYIAVRRGANNMLSTFQNLAQSVATVASPQTLWNPTIAGSTTAGTAVYTKRIGIYSVMGKVVFFTCCLDFNNYTGTGTIKITGLPAAANSTTGYVQYYQNCPYTFQNTTSILIGGTISIKQLTLKIIAGSTFFTLIQVANDGTEATFTSTSGSINFSGFYIAA